MELPVPDAAMPCAFGRQREGVQGRSRAGHTGEAKPGAKIAFKCEERQRPVLRVAAADSPRAGEGWGVCLPASSPHPLCSASARSSHSAHGCCSHPSTSKAGQAVCEPTEPCHRSPSCSLRDLAPCTAGGADKSTSCSPSTIQPQRTAAAPTTCGWVHGTMLAQEATPCLPWPQRRHLPRAIVNHSGEERTDTHCDCSRVALDGSHFPFCCTNHLLLRCSTLGAAAQGLPAPKASSTSIGRNLSLGSSLDCTQS